MDEADLRNRLEHLLVFNHKIEVKRLGQHGVLRTEG